MKRAHGPPELLVRRKPAIFGIKRLVFFEMVQVRHKFAKAARTEPFCALGKEPTIPAATAAWIAAPSAVGFSTSGTSIVRPNTSAIVCTRKGLLRARPLVITIRLIGTPPAIAMSRMDRVPKHSASISAR